MASWTDFAPVSRDPDRYLRSSMSNDPDVYENEFRAEYGRVIAYLRYQGFDRHIAEDAAAEVMTEAWEKAIKADRRAGWVRVAAKRAAIRMTKDDPQTRLRNKGYRPPDADRSGTEVYRAIEQHNEFVNAMRELPDKQRTVMALHLDRMTPKEIADALRIPQRTVYELLKKARAHLRSLIKANEQEGTR